MGPVPENSWLWGLGCPKYGVGLLVSGVGSWGSWLRGLKCLSAGIGLLDRAEAQGIPGLVPAHWWVEPGPEVSGGQGRIPGQLWAQGGLGQQACWWVGLCLCPASILA